MALGWLWSDFGVTWGDIGFAFTMVAVCKKRIVFIVSNVDGAHSVMFFGFHFATLVYIWQEVANQPQGV